MLKLFESLLNKHGFFKKDIYKELKLSTITQRIDAILIYSILWTIGGTIDSPSRSTFGKFYTRLIRDSIKCDTIKDRMVKFEKMSYPPGF